MEEVSEFAVMDKSISDQTSIPYGFIRHTRLYSEAGDYMKDEFAPELKSDGSIELIKVGQTNTREEINSHRDSCDINVILTRYKNGDTKALERRQALYFDATDAPTSYAEMLDRAMKAEGYFATLTAEERAEFDNDWTKWLTSFDDPKRVVKFPTKAEHMEKVAEMADGPGDRRDGTHFIPVEEVTV